MKTIAFHEIGGPEVLRYEDLADPAPGPGQVLVRVKACALNHLDLLVRSRTGVPLPWTTGCDVAGVLAALGAETTGPAVGQAVVVNPTLSCGHCRQCLAGEQSLCESFGILGRDAPGGMAEYLVVPAANLYPLPSGLSFIEAAAVPLVFLTAWRLLMTKARLQAGERILIVGAGGGVATAAIQIASLAGAIVYATTGGPAKVARARDLGADEVVDYRNTDVVAAVQALTHGAGVEVVLDSVGAATWDASIRSLAKGGRLVTCGATHGNTTSFDLRYMWRRQISLIGSSMGNDREFRAVMALVTAGKLRAVVDRVFPLSQAADAEAYLETESQFGKVVLAV